MPIRDPSLTPESIRAAMAIPSTGSMRGLKDGIGFARTPEAMAAVVAASSGEPAWPLGPAPDAPWIGAICPHDDFLYAGRTYRRALEGITAKTVIVIGTFHRWRKFETGAGVFDTYETWFAPDGPVRVSPLRQAFREHVGERARFYLENDSAIDEEHSIEPIVAWLRHRNPDVEILPILSPSNTVDMFRAATDTLAMGLKAAMASRGLVLGRDVQIVISADAIHYGPDFHETRFGAGPEAFRQAVAEDLRILDSIWDAESAVRPIYDALVDPAAESGYRWTWCGRYAIPFGLALLSALARPRGTRAWPLAYETSLSPPLDVHMPPLGFTAPASYEHFVGYPAVAFTL